MRVFERDDALPTLMSLTTPLPEPKVNPPLRLSAIEFVVNLESATSFTSFSAIKLELAPTKIRESNCTSDLDPAPPPSKPNILRVPFLACTEVFCSIALNIWILLRANRSTFCPTITSLTEFETIRAPALEIETQPLPRDTEFAETVAFDKASIRIFSAVIEAPSPKVLLTIGFVVARASDSPTRINPPLEPLAEAVTKPSPLGAFAKAMAPPTPRRNCTPLATLVRSTTNS